MSIIRLISSPSYTLYQRKPRFGPVGPPQIIVTPPPAPPFTPNFFVSPSGGTGSGSIVDPWSLQYALNGANGTILPGDKIGMLGGTYVGTFINNNNGTIDRPIIFRQFNNNRVTISGNMIVFGSYTWFWGFEVVSPTPSIATTNAIQSRSIGAKYIHLVVHDSAGLGITLFDDIGGSGEKPDQEAYGCIVYNNGNSNIAGGATQPWNHGFYSDNLSGYRKLINNISFNNTDFGMQVYPDAQNVTIDRNIIFNNGCTSNPPYIGSPLDLLVGSNPITTPTIITNNAIYREHHGNGSAADIGYFFGQLHTGQLTFTGNYIYGLTEIRDWVTATITNNVVFGVGNYTAPGNAGIWSARGNLSGHTYAGNVWYGDPGGTGFGYGPAGQDPGVAYGFNAWVTATALSSPGAFLSTTPPNQIIINPSTYETGRVHIAVFNWANSASIDVDLSAILAIGQPFAIKSAFNFYGPAVVSGIYAGGSVTIPFTSLPAPPVPANPSSSAPTNPGRTFHAFVVLPN